MSGRTERDPLLSEHRDQSSAQYHGDQSSRLNTSVSGEQHLSTQSTNPVDGGQIVDYDGHLEDDVLQETAPVGRSLSRSSAYIIIASRMLGTGVFATPGSIVKSVGSPGLSILLWILGGILAASGLAVYIELGCMLPRSGGDKVYLEYIYRRPKFLASILIAAQTLFLSSTAGNSMVFGEYVLYAMEAEPTPFRQRCLALAVLAGICLMHSVFRRTGIFIQDLLGWVKIGVMIFMVVTGIVVVATHTSTRTSYPSLPSLFTGSIYTPATLAAASFKISYSYAGFNNLNNVMNEVRDPVRTLKSAAPFALLTVSAACILINVAYFLTIPLDDIKSSGDMIAALYLTDLFGPQVGTRLLPFIIAISAAGNVMVVTFALARVNQEIARTGLLPLPSRLSSLLASSQPFCSPAGGFLLHFIPTALVITLPPPGEVYTFILDVESYPVQIVALATTFGLLLLRRSRSDLKRPFRAWSVAIWLRIVFCAMLVVAPFFPPEDGRGDVSFTWYGTYAVVGVAVLVVAGVYWFCLAVVGPWWGGYQIEERVEVLEDGMAVTRVCREGGGEL